MSLCASAERVEADLAALKVAAERAGVALGCLFSAAGEFEFGIAYRSYPAGSLPGRRSPVLRVLWTTALVVLLLMV